MSSGRDWNEELRKSIGTLPYNHTGNRSPEQCTPQYHAGVKKKVDQFIEAVKQQKVQAANIADHRARRKEHIQHTLDSALDKHAYETAIRHTKYDVMKAKRNRIEQLLNVLMFLLFCLTAIIIPLVWK